ncbi:MAG TPA: hypothetical protein PLO37_23620 [Candidatus Hydrogenedentes bacterium]|nr:hypothetical protein [Candidatus Hydrogenedentota bacterium]
MESEVGRVAYVCSIAAAALLSPDTKDADGESLYIDTGGWAQEVLGDPETFGKHLQFTTIEPAEPKVADATLPVPEVTKSWPKILVVALAGLAAAAIIVHTRRRKHAGV